MSIRLRYAPSPTGLQHLGGVRTALFSFLLAKSQGGTFVLRIEDTDRNRFHSDALEDLHASFAWLGMSWDEGPAVEGPYGPYTQSSRIAFYHDYIERLIQKKHAYRCEEQRELDGKIEHSSVVRLKMPATGVITVTDALLGTLTFQADAVPHDPILIKSDGFPTYHFANVVDDHLMKISHVLRSQEWISSLPIHWYLYEAFGWKKPTFVHLPLIVGKDGKKLSKRHGSTSVLNYRDTGILPEAMWNFLVLLGWSYDDKTHFFTKQQLREVFSFDGINKSQAQFDEERLYSLNAEHIRALSMEEFVGYCQNAIGAELLDGAVLQRKLYSLAPLLQERCTSFADIREHWEYIDYTIAEDSGKRFAHLATCDDTCLEITNAMMELLQEVDDNILQAPSGDYDAIEARHKHAATLLVEQIKQKAGQQGFSNKKFFMTVQESITGRKQSLPVARVIAAIGKNEAIHRLEYRRKNHGI